MAEFWDTILAYSLRFAQVYLGYKIHQEVHGDEKPIKITVPKKKLTAGDKWVLSHRGPFWLAGEALADDMQAKFLEIGKRIDAAQEQARLDAENREAVDEEEPLPGLPDDPFDEEEYYDPNYNFGMDDDTL